MTGPVPLDAVESASAEPQTAAAEPPEPSDDSAASAIERIRHLLGGTDDRS